MNPVKRLSIFCVLSLLTVSSVSCSSTNWGKRSPVLGTEYDIFDTSSATGTGLKLENSSYKPRRCIRSSVSSTTGGQLNIEFVNPPAVMSGEAGPYRDYIRAALKRAHSYNITGMKPVSAACIVSVRGRMNYIVDNSIRLTELAESFLQKNDIDGFYRLCGTRFIDSTMFESAFVFVVTFYMPPEEADSFSRKIIYGRKFDSSDINNFRIFDEAGGKYPVFFSGSSATGTLFIPVEFPAVFSYGHGSEGFLKSIIHSCLSSDSGRITLIHQKKWSELPDVGRYMPQRRGDEFPEEAYDSIASLREDMFDFSMFRLKSPIRELEKGEKIMEALSSSIRWGSYYKCSWGVGTGSYIIPDRESDCSDLLAGLRGFREIENYSPADLTGDKTAELFGSSFRELRLVDAATRAGSDDSCESEYRFNDRTLFRNIPDKISPGETMDSTGRTYSAECIIKDSVVLTGGNSSGISSIKNDCYPVGTRDQGFIKRVLLFWKDPTFKRPLYRGNLEITGFSDELTDSFRITDEAAELARKDIVKFYKKYGTHYVSQVKGRRGIVYYFSPGSAGDSDITLDSYGLSTAELKNTDVSLPPIQTAGGGCVSGITGFFLKQDKEEPLLHPETVGGFFKSKEELVKVLKNGSESVPVEVYLKPWSQYLIERGIIRTDQAVPAKLFQDREFKHLEGEAVISDKNGEVYTGGFSNGLKNGYGELQVKDGSVYKGNWMGDLMHGRGTYRYSSGITYSGDFMYGYPHGTGELKYSSGDLYRGNFYKGKAAGNGEMLFNDGRKYRGDFLDGVPDGYGVMEYPEGKKDTGRFIKGIYQKRE